jgi:hypothetical protein
MLLNFLTSNSRHQFESEPPEEPEVWIKEIERDLFNVDLRGEEQIVGTKSKVIS